jgi:hypothetical protein
MDNKSSTSSRVRDEWSITPVAKNRKKAFESVANRWLDEPPLEVWDHHIIPLLGLRDLALSRPVCTFFEAYWQEKFNGDVLLPLRVGNDVATINDVMSVIEILSSRRVYTKLNPFVVLLGKGNHQITSSWTNQYGTEYATTLEIARNNITFVGTGKDTTTILGGFRIDNFENITFKNMTVTNTSEYGIGIRMRNAKVELIDVALKGCSGNALDIPLPASETTVVATRCEFANSEFGAAVNGSLTSATFNNCVFHSNSATGVYALQNSTIHLHGEATALHSNGRNGISVRVSGQVLIHLPSHHNTSYNNGGQDRRAGSGGTITNVEDSNN